MEALEVLCGGDLVSEWGDRDLATGGFPAISVGGAGEVVRAVFGSAVRSARVLDLIGGGFRGFLGMEADVLGEGLAPGLSPC